MCECVCECVGGGGRGGICGMSVCVCVSGGEGVMWYECGVCV